MTKRRAAQTEGEPLESASNSDLGSPPRTNKKKKQKLHHHHHHSEEQKQEDTKSQKNVLTKRKKIGTGTEKQNIQSVSSLLSEELKNELKNDTSLQGSNALVLSSSNRKKKDKSEKNTREKEPPLSKKEQRKLKQLEEKKRKDQERTKCLKILSENELSQDKLQFLTSSSKMGQRLSAKEKFAKAMRDKAIGVTSSVDKNDVEKYLSRTSRDFNEEWTEDAQNDLYYNMKRKDFIQSMKKNVNKSETESDTIKEEPHEESRTLDEKIQEKKPENKPFITLDFTGLSNTTKQEETSNKINTNNSTDQSEYAESNDGSESEDNESDGEEINKNDVSDKDDNENNVRDDNDDDDDENSDADDNELPWRQLVCKKFSEFFDVIIENVKDEKIQKLLLFHASNLLDIVVPDDSDDENDGEDDDDENDDSYNDIAENRETNNDENLIQSHTLLTSQYENNKNDDDDKEIKLNTTGLSGNRKLQYDEINEILSEGMKKNNRNEPQRYTKYFKLVERKPEIQEQRLQLPVCAEEQPIMEIINENPIFILCGETGSGKTTQVPQFLYEAGYGDEGSGNPGMIGVTQPRRVAVLSTAKRVSEELNLPFGEVISYQIRYDHNISPNTKIKFMTDGILMKEIQDDPLLLRYSVIILDEAHERNINTDILIGWLSRFIPQRNKMAQAKKRAPNGSTITPIKLIIMSATLRVEDFTKNVRLFPIAPPILNVQSRQYPVTVHFSKRTVFTDYVDACYKKVVKIHEKLPNGGILVFLTGKQEIDFLVDKLQSYSKKLLTQKSRAVKSASSKEDTNDNEEDHVINEFGSLSDSEDDMDDDVDDDDNDDIKELEKELERESNERGDRVLFKDNIQDESLKLIGKKNIQTLNESQVQSLYVLPLYSMLQPQQQLKVFQPPPNGKRLCIIATNVAETSLTIPGIRYVVDAGRVKDKKYEKGTGVNRFQIQWISKASADQRAGRAGRTGPGHCYRLYSSAIFDQQFQQFDEPDILKTPIESVVLQMKAMGIKKVENFPFPTPPERHSLKQALALLRNIGTLKGESITDIGKAISHFPVHPRYGKMLLLGRQGECLPYVISIVCGLTVQQIFSHYQVLSGLRQKAIKKAENDVVGDGEDDNDENDNHNGKNGGKKRGLTEEERDLQKRCLKCAKQWEHPESDLLAMLKAIGAYEYAGATDSFCAQNMLHIKNMREAHKLRQQLARFMNDLDSNAAKGILDKFRPPTKEQEAILRQIICAGFIDNAARLATEDDLDIMKINLNKHNPVKPYVTMSMGRTVPVFIHPNSFLHGKQPKYVCYQELFQSNKSNKYFMKGVTVIQQSWLTTLGAPDHLLSELSY